ncbi:MAG: thiol-disulfide isomerase [Bacteroidetes bacterium]|jgi:circadian clock protein KaiB|nr:thiol-disulfide isomerase [Bacteroidota bacterium]
MNSSTVKVKEEYILKLYVTGMSMSSLRAIENIKSICEEHLKGRYDLEIVDIYKYPDTMYENNLIASPTLIKHAPKPFKKLLGDLSNREKVLGALGILK